jgi:hypothetical protein
MKIRGSKFNDIPGLLDPINEENEDDDDFYSKN